MTRAALIACGLLLSLSASAEAQELHGVILWGYDGVERAKEWVSPDGRMNIQTRLPMKPTAIDLWPAAPPADTPDAVAEITLHSTLWDDPCVDRLSLSAMPTRDPDYRISIERGAGCTALTGDPLRALKICFDTPPGDDVPVNAGCRLIVRPDGVWISRDGRRWTLL